MFAFQRATILVIALHISISLAAPPQSASKRDALEGRQGSHQLDNEGRSAAPSATSTLVTIVQGTTEPPTGQANGVFAPIRRDLGEIDSTESSHEQERAASAAAKEPLHIHVKRTASRKRSCCCKSCHANSGGNAAQIPAAPSPTPPADPSTNPPPAPPADPSTNPPPAPPENPPTNPPPAPPVNPPTNPPPAPPENPPTNPPPAPPANPPTNPPPAPPENPPTNPPLAPPADPPADPAAAEGGEPAYMSIVRKWLSKGGFPPLAHSTSLEQSALQAATINKHTQLSGTATGVMGQVLGPGNADDFEKTFVGGWLCERVAEYNKEFCAKGGWKYTSEQHVDILTKNGYKNIGCAHANAYWACDLNTG